MPIDTEEDKNIFFPFYKDLYLTLTGFTAGAQNQLPFETRSIPPVQYLGIRPIESAAKMDSVKEV
jgi:hypothetical protein